MFKGEIPRLPLLSPCKIVSYKWAPLIQRSLGTCVDWNGGVWLPSSAVSGHFAMLLQYVDFLPNAGCLLTFWFPEFYYKNALFFTLFPPFSLPLSIPPKPLLSLTLPHPPTSQNPCHCLTLHCPASVYYSVNILLLSARISRCFQH